MTHSEDVMKRIGHREGEQAIRRRVEAVISTWNYPGHACFGTNCVPCALLRAKHEVERALHAG